MAPMPSTEKGGGAWRPTNHMPNATIATCSAARTQSTCSPLFTEAASLILGTVEEKQGKVYSSRVCGSVTTPLALTHSPRHAMSSDNVPVTTNNVTELQKLYGLVHDPDNAVAFIQFTTDGSTSSA